MTKASAPARRGGADEAGAGPAADGDAAHEPALVAGPAQRARVEPLGHAREELRHRQRLVEVAHGPEAHVRALRLQWVHVERRRLVRVRRLQRADDVREPPPAHLYFDAPLRYGLRRPPPPCRWRGRRRGPGVKCPVPAGLERAAGVGADLPGAGLGERRAHAAGVGVGHEGDEL